MASNLTIYILQGVLGLILGAALAWGYNVCLALAWGYNVCFSRPKRKHVAPAPEPPKDPAYVLKLRGQGFTAEECVCSCIVTRIRVRPATHEEFGTPFQRAFHPGDVLIPLDPSSDSRYLLLEIREKGFSRSSMVVDPEVLQEGLRTGWLLRLGHLSVLTRMLSQLQAMDVRPLVAYSSVDLSYDDDCELLVQALPFLNLAFFSRRHGRPSQEAKSQYDRLLDEDLV